MAQVTQGDFASGSADSSTTLTYGVTIGTATNRVIVIYVSTESGVAPSEVRFNGSTGARCVLLGSIFNDLVDPLYNTTGASGFIYYLRDMPSQSLSTTTNGTTLLTSAGLFGSLIVGAVISGANIPAGTVIDSIADTSNLTMSAAATGSSSASRTFDAIPAAGTYDVYILMGSAQNIGSGVGMLRNVNYAVPFGTVFASVNGPPATTLSTDVTGCEPGGLVIDLAVIDALATEAWAPDGSQTERIEQSYNPQPVTQVTTLSASEKVSTPGTVNMSGTASPLSACLAHLAVEAKPVGDPPPVSSRRLFYALLAAWQIAAPLPQARPKLVPIAAQEQKVPLGRAWLPGVLGSWIQSPAPQPARPRIIVSVDNPPVTSRARISSIVSSWQAIPHLAQQRRFAPREVVVEQPPFGRAWLSSVVAAWAPTAPPSARRVLRPQGQPTDNPPFGLRPWMPNIIERWQPPPPPQPRHRRRPEEAFELPPPPLPPDVCYPRIEAPASGFTRISAAGSTFTKTAPASAYTRETVAGFSGTRMAGPGDTFARVPAPECFPPGYGDDYGFNYGGGL